MIFRRFLTKRTLAIASATTATTAVGGYYYLNSGPSYPASTVETRRPPPPWTPPSRKAMLDAMKSSEKALPGSDEEFDLLIVGGGATGAGVAVDAASRGLKVALVERNDFSCVRASLIDASFRLQDIAATLDLHLNRENSFRYVPTTHAGQGIDLSICPYIVSPEPTRPTSICTYNNQNEEMKTRVWNGKKCIESSHLPPPSDKSNPPIEDRPCVVKSKTAPTYPKPPPAPRVTTSLGG
ncbi:hypothetical protein SCHPADRAFT_947636 [Schizopora paradoxa]|uniref:Glycerol-3-phosphate dehydrogenase n=1 Tax=Schizopora paradoxa TaxID=27342 RepID=A0A0H2QY80_9AGAM|nr:hypothetical protein SCHPADRAFT_947636 [Schizopora paradoxa]